MTERTKTGFAPAWKDEDEYWRTHYSSRPYVEGQPYDTFEPGYRYGFDAATRYSGRDWDDVERELESEWDRYEYKGTSTWQQVKDAVRDAWARVTGR